MPCCKAWMQRPSGLIKIGGSAGLLRWDCRNALIKVENALKKIITAINQNTSKDLARAGITTNNQAHFTKR